MGQKKLKSFRLEEFIKFLKTERYSVSELHIDGKKLECDFRTGLCQIRVDGVRVWSGIGPPIITKDPEKLLESWIAL